MLIVYFCFLFFLSVYSYALVDPNFTLVNSSLWEVFRNYMVNLGYYQRGLSTTIFLGLLLVLTFFNWYFWKKGKNPVRLGLLIAAITILAYPFLSHDFFNYLFDAKIFTFYGQNPYLHKALDFPEDSWLRFMHWTHRTYPYGPVFLLLTFVPSFFSFGKLVLAFLFFKLLFAVFYLLAVWALSKFSKKKALFFATSPLVIIEGLVNNHNDFLGVSFAIMALYFWHKQKKAIVAFLLGLGSFGIKYVSVLFLPLFKKSKLSVWLSLALTILIFGYIYTQIGIHSWYLLNLFILLPFLLSYSTSFLVLSFGLLVSYYPYLMFGGWDETWKVELKEQIILVTLLLFFLTLVLTNREKQKHYFL